MRFDKFTIKAQELIQEAHAVTSKHHNQQIEPEHLLAAMLAETGGIAGAVVTGFRLGLDGAQALDQLRCVFAVFFAGLLAK